MTRGNSSSLENIGERIRSARMKAGLTQEELAGEAITRNMLSRIENGAALPSLPTLCAIADRLGIPAGALLGDLSDYASYRLASELRALLVKKKYVLLLERYESAGGNFSDGNSATSNSAVQTDELAFILCEACAGRAWELFNDGRLGEARALLDRASRYSEATTFDTSDADGRILICRMLADNTEKPKSSDEQLKRLIFRDNELAIYLYAKNMLAGTAGRAYSVPDESAEQFKKRLEPLISELPDGIVRSHIEAKLDMASADYLSAKAKLVPYIDEHSKLPPTVLFDLYTDLELCCKCCGDFENAYKYSSVKLALLQKIK